MYPCERCSQCGSNLAEAPGLHREPEPHRMQAERVKVKTDSGLHDAGKLTCCIWCHDTMAVVDEGGEPWVHWPNPERVFFLDGQRFHYPHVETLAVVAVRSMLSPERCGYLIHVDDPAHQPLGSCLNDNDSVPWGSRFIALPQAHR